MFALDSFRDPVERTALINDAYGSYDNIRILSEKNISVMATDLSGRTVAAGRIIFRTRRTKLLKALSHWVTDFHCVFETPQIDGLAEVMFKANLQCAVTRAEVRKTMSDQASSAADAASPGPLESERKWKQWEEKFINYTHTKMGAFGIPLSYAIRENDAPNANGVFTDFVSKTIACAPLTGDADKLAVFNMIVAFTTGQPSGEWIKQTVRYADGRECT